MNRILAMRAVLLLVAASGPGLATAADESGPWSGKAGVGYLATSGNSENTSLNAVFQLSYDLDSWHHGFTAQAIGAESNAVTTAERYQAGIKSKYDFTEHDYIFGLVNWERDRFGGYKEQLSEAVGYGRRLLNSDAHVLNVELGVGAKQADLFDGSKLNGIIGRAAVDYLWNFSDAAKFSQLVAVESGSGNTYIESISAITARLIDSLNLVVSFTVKNNSDVPAGRDKTDTFTAVNIEYAF